MATGAQLITRVGENMKLAVAGAAGTGDRPRILTWLQEALEDTLLDAEISTAVESSGALTAGQDTYVFGTAPFSSLLAINHLRVTSSSVTRQPLQQVSKSELDEMRQGPSQSNGDPGFFAVQYPRIYLYPAPSTGSTIYVDGLGTTPTLADSATDLATATTLPPFAHYSVLVPKACYLAAIYKSQPSAERFLPLYDQGIRRLKKFRARAGGLQRPEPYGSRGLVRTDPSQDFGPFA